MRVDRHAYRQTYRNTHLWILIKQQMTVWQRRQPDHMQIICSSLRDNQAAMSKL